jgi:hypothetical protein
MRREDHDYCSEILSIAGVIAVSSTPALIQGLFLCSSTLLE